MSYYVNMVTQVGTGIPVAPAAIVSPKRAREITVTRWERAAEAIREQIRTGDHIRTDDDGVRWLPSYAQLEKQHRVSYGTLRYALGELRRQGWVEGEPGVGVRVRDDHPR